MYQAGYFSKFYHFLSTEYRNTGIKSIAINSKSHRFRNDDFSVSGQEQKFLFLSLLAERDIKMYGAPA